MDKIRFKSKPIHSRGIICGADKTQEWLLPWWYSRLRSHQADPILFCDFGMSEDARSWCAERGAVLPVFFDPSWVAPKEKIDPDLVLAWEKMHSTYVWEIRNKWFKKPFALLCSIFQRGLWLDLDCEVLGPLDPLFDLISPESEMGIMREFNNSDYLRYDEQALYNGGVIVFEHGADIIEKWADAVMSLTHLFWGDDHLLSYLINSSKIPVCELPPIFNWRVSQGININAVICHWIGQGGKDFIRQFGGFKPTLEKFSEKAATRQSATR